MVEGPLRLCLAEDLAEELPGSFPAQETVLVVGVLIVEPGGHGHGLHPQRGEVIEKFCRITGCLPLEKRGIGGDPETGGHQLSDRGRCPGKGTLVADSGVVPFGQAVEVDIEGQVGTGLKTLQLALDEQAVGAEVDKPFLPDELADNGVDLRMEQRLSAGNGHHRRAALPGRAHALVHGEHLLHDLARLVDLAASLAVEVAEKKGLEHQDQGEFFRSPEQPADDIRTDASFL